MAQKRYVVEVEKAKEAAAGRPSVGPVYRHVFAKDGFAPPTVETCWDNFRVSVEKYVGNRMLGEREIVMGEAGNYVWLTYKEVYDVVLRLGASIRSRGADKGARCGICGPNSTKWFISMQACNAHGLYCVPLYDNLGSSPMEYIICHAEISIAFVEEAKISEVMQTFPRVSKYLETLVSFGIVTIEQKEVAKTFGVAIDSWDEFILLGINNQFELPVKEKSDVCSIIFTSGTTKDPKGVMITNESILSLVCGTCHHLRRMSAEINDADVYMSYLPLAHMFDRITVEQIIHNGGSIGFWQGNIKQLMNDLRALKPSIFIAVPRVLENIYSGEGHIFCTR